MMESARGPQLALLALAVLLLTASAVPPAAARQSLAVVYPLPHRTPSPVVSWELEVAVLNLINQERVAAALAPLMPHATIRSAARAHGIDMFAFGYLSHQSRSGLSPQQRVLRTGVRVRQIGENLAYAADIRAAHEALMASEGHRQNILTPGFRLIGIGVVDGGPLGVVIVQDFSD